MKKEKRFEGLKKRNYMIELKKAFYKENKVTVCALSVAIPTGDLVPVAMSKHLFNRIRGGFPNVRFNFDVGAPAFLINVRGKSVCTSDDKYDEALGETIAYSKAQAKAYSVVSRISAIIASDLIGWGTHAGNVSEFFNMASEREIKFVKSI